jgi:uncharacterized protein (TIGR02444 family)
VSGSSNTNSFKRFALELYRRAGVADACLDLQNRHDLDVNVVLYHQAIDTIAAEAHQIDLGQ